VPIKANERHPKVWEEIGAMWATQEQPNWIRQLPPQKRWRSRIAFQKCNPNAQRQEQWPPENRRSAASGISGGS